MLEILKNTMIISNHNINDDDDEVRRQERKHNTTLTLKSNSYAKQICEGSSTNASAETQTKIAEVFCNQILKVSDVHCTLYRDHISKAASTHVAYHISN